MLKDRLVELRKEKKRTQGEIAKVIGVTRPAYTAYEKGNRTPDYKILESLADYFDVTTDYLLGRTNNRNESVKDDFDSLAEIKKIVDDLGIEDLFFHNIDDWKNLTPEDVEEIRNHFEYVAHKARKRKEKNND
ncbi:helix-turn-helix domain-containing protein [Virgibacillus sp. FSP13]